MIESRIFHMECNKMEIFGLIKTLGDAHTMGIRSAAALLQDCGYQVLISPSYIEDAMEKIYLESNQEQILDWILKNNISHIGFSYRLDPDTAVKLMGRLIYTLKANGYYEGYNPQVKSVFFAGLTPACNEIDKEYGGRVPTFRGGESAEETLLIMGVPFKDIPRRIRTGNQYDKELAKFGEKIIKVGRYKKMKAPERKKYPEFGTDKDTLELRLDNNYKERFQPIIRAHSGPYSADRSRNACLREYCNWCHELGKAGFLDVLSIGSSQLSQSNFGESWDGKANGGGVPVNSETEYMDIWLSARPMLVRTYSGTKNIRGLAEIYERSINISWHALSLWWFNQLDGRGPNSLYDNLKEHLETIRYIAITNKPVETNVSHHFAFRGCDDVTYILAGFLAAKTAKRYGVKTFVLQNMLNTPRSTWGIQDLAKGRTLLKLVKELEDKDFRVIFQTRAGLDYFKPNIEVAKAQLASVTAMMDDIDPFNEYSPDIIHVVSYSEALFLATPEVINDSIKITRTALQEYRKQKNQGNTPDVMTDEIKIRQTRLESSVRKIIRAMEENVSDLYSPEGLYLAFVAGWLPVPELWSDSEEFRYAKGWGTKLMDGGMALCNHDMFVTDDDRIHQCIGNMSDAKYILKHKYLKHCYGEKAKY